ncbi:Flagellar-associated PapD-like, putative [Leishmania donovani]|uniref:Flagellar-associated PapD-like, putative n=1 Tax=Leishmania donovani TaxID=5661 RepID=A0A3S7WUW5_LEIDO|nr:Flagellar-associated PapD-like, putative [Leishmania donovani]
MDFLSFDNGVIKNPFYRKDVVDGDGGYSTHRKWNRQPRDAINSATPAYTRDLLSEDKTPFQCNPAAVCFADYDVGIEHKIVVAFTNTATVPKTFRVMPILPRYANVVSVEYTVPPRISPGLSWNVTVKYRPCDVSDISTAIYVKTDEGYFAVPLTSSKKAFVFSVEPRSVSFGTVIVGEKRAKVITLRNSGAMPGTVIVGGDFKSLLEQKHTNPVDGKQMSCFRISPQQYKIEIPSFSKSLIVLSFAPLNPTQINSEITFTEKNSSQLPHAISITGSSTNLPVFLTTGKLEFGACFYGERYWDEVSVVNKANIAAVAEFQVPPSLVGALAVSPSRVCVQSGEEYSVRVVFTPSKDLPKDFSSVIKCVVQNQILPLTLNVDGVLSHRAPCLPSTAFDIGTIPLQTMRSVQVPVTNESSVKQLVGFDNLPPWVVVTPEVLALVPFETASFTLKMEAPQEGRFSHRLKLINEFGDTQHISVSGQGTRPPLALSARTLLLPPCNIGRSVFATTVLSNTSGKLIQFRFFVPRFFFKVSPNAGFLQPGESVVVAIFFHAPMEYEYVESPQPAAPPHRARPKKDVSIGFVSDAPPPQKQSMYDDWESGSEKELWSRHKQFRIQCCLNGLDDECCFIVVRCCAVRPSARIEEAEKAPSTLPTKQQKPTESDARRVSVKGFVVADRDENVAKSQSYKGEVFIEFGKVPIHHASIRSCKVHNTGDAPFMIRAPPLNPFSSFSILAVAFDEVPPHTEAEIHFSFHPDAYGKFNELIKVELAMPDDTVAFVFVNMQGTCSPTQLTITPAESVLQQDASSIVSVEHLAFDCTQKSESTRKGLSFHNVGSFSLEILITSYTEEGENAHNVSNAVLFDPSDILPFLVHPRAFTLQPNTKQIVDVVFAPSDAGVYSKRLSIAASGETRELALEGRSVSGGIYCFVPISDVKTGRSTAVSFEGGIGCQPDYPVSLSFAEEESKILILGNLLKGLSVEYSAQNWEQTRPLEMSPEWSVTPLSQVIASGKEARLSVHRSFAEDEEGEGVLCGINSLFPFRFTVVLRGEGAELLAYRTLYVVCTD